MQLAVAWTNIFASSDFGPSDEVKEGTRACSHKTIQVHPASATLVKGRKRDDDSMTSTRWTPSRIETSSALVCTSTPELLLPFTKELAFVTPRRVANNEEARGVEWSFVNSDMVIQQGGYRWIPLPAQ